eukprot:m.32121 g.32121  ORF g.32121 m.32121 type:complete len:137 (-) comp42211_c0_seq6:60-470(-)
MSALDLARKAGHSRIAVLLGEHQHRLACAAAGPGIHAKRALHDPTLSVSQAAETEAPDLRSGEMVQPLGSKDCTMERDEDLALSLATEVEAEQEAQGDVQLSPTKSPDPHHAATLDSNPFPVMDLSLSTQDFENLE